MKQKTIFLLLLLLTLAACSPAGGEPAASDDPPTAIPSLDESASSDDPTATPLPDKPIEPESVILDEAQVESISIAILESFPVQVHVNVSGFLGDGCTTLAGITITREENIFFVTITKQRPADEICTQQLTTFEENVALDVNGLLAGTYTVNVNGVTDSFTLDMDNVLELPGTDDESLSDIELSSEDKAELLRLTLERALVAQEIPDYTLLAEQPEIVLSTENIDPTLVPELDGVSLVMMTPEEIQAKADANGDFPYLQVQGVTAVSNDEVRVSLGSQMARAANSEIIYLIGGGFTIAYSRTADGWVGEVKEMWIS